jgi:L-ascorbate metabolism protein UlaG (beta-lactamase superfamily)
VQLPAAIFFYFWYTAGLEVNMIKKYVVIAIIIIVSCFFLKAGALMRTDVIKTGDGELKITFIGHGTLMMNFKGMVIHIDPFSRLTDYSKLPKADLILLTHHHGDHLDPRALDLIRTDKTILIYTEACLEKAKAGIVMKNGDNKTIKGLKIEAVPAYNVKHKRASGEPYHPKGEGNGYVVTFGKKRVYVAGDTENTPEMKALKDIDIAFLPMNLPYTMTPEMVSDAAKTFKPKRLYLYHFSPEKSDIAGLQKLMKEVKGVELIIPNKK